MFDTGVTVFPYKDIAGSTRYYIYGTIMLHREDGPAVLHYDGSRYWFLYDKLHRIDGPAITYPNGEVCWFVDNKRIKSAEDFKQQAKLTDDELILLILKYGDIT